MTEFYTGSPLLPEDLWYRDDFIAQLWEDLQNQHVILAAPRRTGKTSVMDHMAARPHNEFCAVSVFVQDLDHPREFLLTLLDAFHQKAPNVFRRVFETASGWIRNQLDRISDVELAGFKVALREGLPNTDDAWKTLGNEQFFPPVRKSGIRLLFIVDEFPDFILNMHRNHPHLVQPFLSWLRGHCMKPAPPTDNIRWLLGGSVNLSTTLDSLGALDLVNEFHVAELPVLTDDQVQDFVRRMLTHRKVQFAPEVPACVARRLGRPVPYFLQLMTQQLFRAWRQDQRTLSNSDVDACFDALIVSSAARDKLQHFYSRIQRYYSEPKRSAAYELLAEISLSSDGLTRTQLLQCFERVLQNQALTVAAHERKQLLHQLLRDLENDFYIVELTQEDQLEPNAESRYDFASGLLKSWWKKYYA